MSNWQMVLLTLLLAVLAYVWDWVEALVETLM
jgi:hypothetical protein